MNIKLELQKEKKRIVSFLDNFHKDSAEIVQESVWGKDALSRLFNYTKEGKMLRGALLLWSAEWHGIPSKEALPIALALELTQSALLIHDDIMDEDILRRGKDSMHVQYEKQAESNVLRKDHYGLSMSICVGDLSAFLCYKLLSKINKDKLANILGLFADSFALVGLGQMQDVALGLTTSIPTSENVLLMYKQKTAEYTFCLPLQAGAAFAGATEKQLKHLHELGTNLGVLFQLKDDELGMFGTNGSLGKSVGLDIVSGKKTLIYLLLWEQLDAKEQKRLSELPNKKASKEDFAFIHGLLDKYKIKKESQAYLQKYADASLKQISVIDLPATAKELLREVVDYSLKRSS